MENICVHRIAVHSLQIHSCAPRRTGRLYGDITSKFTEPQVAIPLDLGP